jgi:hypothetical protein
MKIVMGHEIMVELVHRL